MIFPVLMSFWLIINISGCSSENNTTSPEEKPSITTTGTSTNTDTNRREEIPSTTAQGNNNNNNIEEGKLLATQQLIKQLAIPESKRDPEKDFKNKAYLVKLQIGVDSDPISRLREFANNEDFFADKNHASYKSFESAVKKIETKLSEHNEKNIALAKEINAIKESLKLADLDEVEALAKRLEKSMPAMKSAEFKATIADMTNTATLTREHVKKLITINKQHEILKGIIELCKHLSGSFIALNDRLFIEYIIPRVISNLMTSNLIFGGSPINYNAIKNSKEYQDQIKHLNMFFKDEKQKIIQHYEDVFDQIVQKFPAIKDEIKVTENEITAYIDERKKSVDLNALKKYIDSIIKINFNDLENPESLDVRKDLLAALETLKMAKKLAAKPSLEKKYSQIEDVLVQVLDTPLTQLIALDVPDAKSFIALGNIAKIYAKDLDQILSTIDNKALRYLEHSIRVITAHKYDDRLEEFGQQKRDIITKVAAFENKITPVDLVVSFVNEDAGKKLSEFLGALRKMRI